MSSPIQKEYSGLSPVLPCSYDDGQSCDNTGDTRKIYSNKEQALSDSSHQGRFCLRKVECVGLLGEPSGRVTIPRKCEGKYEIHFNRSLAPGGSYAVRPSCKNYTPNIEGDLIQEISKAMNEGVNFVLCLVDINASQESVGYWIPKVTNLIDFCNARSIPVANFIDEQDIATFNFKTSELITEHFPPNTPTIIKSTYSIFSTPETHDYFRKIEPDALIFAGELANVCIRASISGFDESDIYSSYGAEFGAVQYGYPVYTHKSLIKAGISATIPIQNELLFSFKKVSVTQMVGDFNRMDLSSDLNKRSHKRKICFSKKQNKRVKRIKLENSFFVRRCEKAKIFFLPHGPNISSRKSKRYFRDSDILGSGYLYRKKGLEPCFCMGYVDSSRQIIVQVKPVISNLT